MRKLNLHDMYILGKRLEPLGKLKWDDKVVDHMGPLWFGRGALEEYVSDSSPLLEAAKRAARKVISSINSVLPTDFEQATKVNKEVTLGWPGYRIREDIEALESVLANEMPGVPAYIVSQKGIYRTEDLIDHAERQFPDEFRCHIPPQAVIDIQQAGKCLAFNLPTACSFHLWRALETVMDAYYARITSSSFDDDKVSRNWGAKIKALKEKNAENAVTNYLDHIRQQYRNPQTHPDEVVQENEAIMLFGVAGSAIISMVIAIQSFKPALPSPVAAVAS